MDKGELWRKYRPTTFDEVVGQDQAVSLLTNYLKRGNVPHSILFTGISGGGKSTLAHIMASEMGCDGIDKNVIDCASEEKPLDAIRNLRRCVRTSPSGKSKCRIWILEELQAWSRAGYAQQAMLLILEDHSPASLKSYLFACTTNPEKIKEAVRNRCKKIEIRPLTAEALTTLLTRIAKKEGRDLPESVVDKIIEVAGGSAREAVNQLDSALNAGDDEETMLDAVLGLRKDDNVWKLLRAMFYERPAWDRVARIIKDVTDDPERFRHAVLKMAANEMLKGGKNAPRAFLIAEVFGYSWEQCTEAGLARSCWEVVQRAVRK